MATDLGTSLRLVDTTGAELLSVGPFGPTILTRVDVGFPDVRDAVQPLSGQDGVTDTTAFLGARAVVAEMVLPAVQPHLTADSLRGLLHPSWRYYLHLRRDGWPAERRILVRGNDMALGSGPPLRAQVTWKAPGPAFEDAAATTVTLSPVAGASDGMSGGMSFPSSFPVTFASGLVPGAALVTVGGTVPTSPIIDMYGPCSDPALVCVTTGARIAFTGLTLAAGDFLRVNMGARTALLNNDPAQSRYNRFDFTRSSWWLLPVGLVQVAFSPSMPGVGCQAVLSYRARWL